MKTKTLSFFSVSLAIMLALSGCSTQVDSVSPMSDEVSLNSPDLSGADAERLATSPKVQGYIINPTLESSFGKNGMVINVLGKISKLYAPRVSCMDDGAYCFDYIPVEIEVLASLPSLGDSKIILRSWPTAEHAEDPRLLKVGDIVMTNPVEKTIDGSGLEAYSLGNIFHVDNEGVIREYNDAADPLGTLSDVDKMLGTQFENLFEASK